LELWTGGNPLNFVSCWNPVSFIFDYFVYPFSLVTNLLNAAMFIPLAPIWALFKRSPKWWMILIFFTSIELMQVFLGCGYFDMGDIVLYTLGYLCGAGIVRMYKDNVKKNSGESSSEAAVKLTHVV
jgi:glycopeptide antibiotics resistance protein